MGHQPHITVIPDPNPEPMSNDRDDTVTPSTNSEDSQRVFKQSEYEDGYTLDEDDEEDDDDDDEEDEGGDE